MTAWLIFTVLAICATNLACYVVGFAVGAARADADIDDAFDTGHAFGTYRAAGDGS